LFYRWLSGEESTYFLPDINTLDPILFSSLQHVFKFVTSARSIAGDNSLTDAERSSAIASLRVDNTSVDDLDLDFTLPGQPGFELRKGGKDILVTNANVEQYIQLVVHWFLYEGAIRQMESFKEGFESVISLTHLKMFFPEEMEQLFCGSSSKSGAWDATILLQCIKPDHGYCHDSPPVQWLIQTMAGFNPDEQRQFLQFVTGCPKLPVGGFKSLTPPLTVVRKAISQDASDSSPDSHLPSVMTCVNYLKLPEYSNADVLRERLLLAVHEGQKSFHLS
jgi:E3 ubiquitin-protein ligase TRIP12